jgi:hypothetical protein
MVVIPAGESAARVFLYSKMYPKSLDFLFVLLEDPVMQLFFVFASTYVFALLVRRAFKSAS